MSDRITESDLEHHQRMLARLQEAQAIAQQVEQAKVRIVELTGAWKLWVEDLYRKYDVAMDGSEAITLDGQIQRVTEQDQVAPDHASRAPDSELHRDQSTPELP